MINRSDRLLPKFCVSTKHESHNEFIKTINNAIKQTDNFQTVGIGDGNDHGCLLCKNKKLIAFYDVKSEMIFYHIQVADGIQSHEVPAKLAVKSWSKLRCLGHSEFHVKYHRWLKEYAEKNLGTF